MTTIKKIIALIIAVAVGVLFCMLLTGLLRLIGASKPSPAFAFAAYGASIFLGRWVYHIICNLILKKKDKEEVVESQAINVELLPKDKNEDEVIYESDSLK